jgi:hypothetical protein
MNRLRVTKIIAISLTVLLVGLLVLYAVSGRTCRAVFFIGQGWSSHYIANAFLSAGMDSSAIACQRLSIESYERALQNLESDDIRALVVDEWRALLNIYIQRRNYSDAVDAITRVEGMTRKEGQLGTRYETRRRAYIGEVLLCHARLRFAQGNLAGAAEIYKQAIATGDALIGDKLAGPSLDSQLSSARKELAMVLEQQVESRDKPDR